MYYSRTKNKIFIDWDEKGKNGVEHWHGDFTPINVFYHPKRKSELIRVTLKGKMPKWVERFASHIKFKSGSTSDEDGKQGFWLANWNAWEHSEKPISSTNLDGAIYQFIKKIPDSLKELKDKVKQNKDIIKENLIKNPTFFEDFGVYYKAEEIEGSKGTLLIDNDIFLFQGEYSDEDYKRMIEIDGRLEKVIHELISPVPEPIPEMTEEETVEEEFEDELFDEDDLIFEEEELLLDSLNDAEESENLDDFLIEESDEIFKPVPSENTEEIVLEEDTHLAVTEVPSDEITNDNLTLDEVIEPDTEISVGNQKQDEPKEEVNSNKHAESIITPNNESVQDTKSILIDLEKERIVVQPKKRATRKKSTPTQETIPLF